ncbi:hypothetical protein [Desulfobacterium sp. N47]|uniref:Lipoprotein n=1 Tax=uncultured Desulfobacterium sp. TaxID=201089 RepID=E1YLF1_9BACT|nr:unknown protein [uncultured Desulfobacterium sp.]
MMKKYLFILFISFLLIGGCSGKEDQTGKERSDKEHILSDQVRALEKAKGVEQVLQKSTDKRITDIEEQNK